MSRSRYPVSIDNAVPGKLVRMRTRPATGGVTAAAPASGSNKAAAASVAYVGRTLLPLPSTIKRQSTYTIQAGDRIDNVSTKLLGDPLLYWMLLEANGTSDPAALCARPGRKIIVPAAVGQGSDPFDQPVAAQRSNAPALVSKVDDSEESP